MLSPNLEQTLRRALAYANDRRHDYATLEHLLLALVDDQDAIAVMRACNVDVERLRRDLSDYVDNQLGNIVGTHHAEAKPTAGFQRVLQRAAIHVQSSGREEVTGANILVALFSERESHAVFFLQEQEMSRLDAVNYISHGIAKAPGRSEARRVRGADPGSRGQWRGEDRQRCARGLLRQPQPEGQGRPHRPADRARAGGQPHHPGAVPPHQEQPALCRRSRRRQDRHRRRPGAPHRQRGRAGCAEERHHLRARHGRAAGRHALSRRFRGALEGGGEGAGGDRRRHPVHRRDPHRDRRRRHLGRLDGCIEPAEARSAVGPAALHRLHHLQGIPAVFREGPRPGPPLPEDRRQRAVGRGCGEDPARPEAVLREAPFGALHPGGDPRLGRAGGALHQRPQAARQGDRRDRRGRRGADAAAGIQAQEDHHGEGRRGDGRHHRPHPTQVGQQGRQGDA